MQHRSPPKCSSPSADEKLFGELENHMGSSPQPDIYRPPIPQSHQRAWKPYIHRDKGRQEFTMSSDICPLWRADWLGHFFCANQFILEVR